VSGVLPDAVGDADTSRVGGRNLLVIGSQCEGLPELSFLPDVATELYEAMTDPERGACQPALDPSGLVIDPTVAEAKQAIRAAFERAAKDEATLLLAFMGHGEQVTEDGDFYFLPTDAEANSPDDDTALNLVSQVKGLRRRYETDGLVVLLDTCYSGMGAVAAGRVWPSLSLEEFRFEFLAATADRSAFDGCFSKSLIQWVQTGMSGGASVLRCEAVREALKERCPNQVPQHVYYQGDPGLFLARNVAPEVRANPLVGIPAADNAAALTVWFQPTADLERVVEFSQRQPLMAVVGDAGAGKSAIAAALIRPEVAPGIVPPRFAQAAVFASESSTPAQVAMDLSGQLGRSVPGFTELARSFERAASEEEWNGLDALHRHVVGPLTLHKGGAVRIILDAIDQLPEDSSAAVRAALPVLADMGVRTVVTTRPDAWLPGRTEQLHIGAADSVAVGAFLANRGIGEEVAHKISVLASGNWLVVSLLADLVSGLGFDVASFSASPGSIYDATLSSMGAGESQTWENEYRPILTVLAAAGTGPVLPMPLLQLASEKLGGPPRIGSVRDTLVRLRRLVVRGRPGTEEEQVGLFHPTLETYLSAPGARYSIDVRQGHGAIHQAIDELAPLARHDPADPLHRYAAQMEPEHLWAIGEYQGVTSSLAARASVIPAENLRRWRSWEARFAAQVGKTHPETLNARGSIAAWTGEAGDARGALQLSQELLTEEERVLGPDHPHTLATRGYIATSTGATGDARGALQLSQELLTDRERVLGPDHPDTLAARGSVAGWTGQAGDARGALRLSKELLTDQERMLGPEHPDTLAARNNIAIWTGLAGNARRALRLLQELLPDLERVLGQDNPTTLAARANIAEWTGRRGVLRGPLALRLWQELLPDLDRVLGPDHPATFSARGNIAAWTGRRGDARGALRLLQELLPDLDRVLGQDNPTILAARNNIAHWTGEAGDARGALRLSKELLTDQERVLGPEHPTTLGVRNNIAFCTGQAGDARGALRLFDELLPDLERVLGTHHQATRDARATISRYRKIARRSGGRPAP
jgi:Caspase domain/Tetratricopeptide repeat